MSENKRYYWLRLYDDFFTSKRIKKLRKLGADYLIIYLKLQLMSLKNDGVIEFDGIESTLAEELAIDIDEDADKIQITLAFLQSCKLLEPMDETEFFLPYVDICTGSETASTRRSQKSRAQKTLQCNAKVLQCNTDATNCNTDATKCNGEKEIEKEIEKKKEIERETTERNLEEIFQKSAQEADVVQMYDIPASVPYQRIMDAYHEICVSYPKVKVLSEDRKKAIRARLKTYSEADIVEMFHKAEASDFLKGANDRNWSATFDWLMRDRNLAKVLDGNYDNRGKAPSKMDKYEAYFAKLDAMEAEEARGTEDE